MPCSITFLATLHKVARVWYSWLEARSIDSFSQLERKFVAHFNACHKILREANSLFSVCQQDGKSLKDYVAWFKIAMLEVYYLDEFVAMLTLKRGLRPYRFTYSLDKTSLSLIWKCWPACKSIFAWTRELSLGVRLMGGWRKSKFKESLAKSNSTSTTHPIDRVLSWWPCRQIWQLHFSPYP